jgi:hypothetical protein
MKKLLLIAFIGYNCHSINAQSSVPAPKSISQIEIELNNQVQNIEKKDHDIFLSSNSSRGINRQLIEEKKSLLIEYRSLLNQAIEVASDAQKMQFYKEELIRIEKELNLLTEKR